jgi:hypothetical protein
LLVPRRVRRVEPDQRPEQLDRVNRDLHGWDDSASHQRTVDLRKPACWRRHPPTASE